MSNDNAAGVATWLASHADVALPPERLGAYARATQAACATVAARSAELAMEDEPANFVAALDRLAEAKR